jgi:hypothetical protein
MQTEDVEVFPFWDCRGLGYKSVSVRVPIAVYERLCTAVRPYARVGLTRETFRQIFLTGFDFIVKTYGLEAFVKRLAEEYKTEKKQHEKGGGDPDVNPEQN